MESVTAQEALERLQQGNERFRNGVAEGAGRDIARRQELAGNQYPYAIVLCCSDSRVAPEIAFDAGLGDLFVVRVAGNVANTSSIGSIEYAVANLGTKLVLVMGHENCGAVGAVVSVAQKGGDINTSLDYSRNLIHLLGHIRPAPESSEDHEADAVARTNARLTGERLIDESEIISGAVENDGVQIVSAFYQLGSGAVGFD